MHHDEHEHARHSSCTHWRQSNRAVLECIPNTARVARRGRINRIQIDRYLNQTVEDVVKFDIERIINMDETFIQTLNFS